MTAPDLTFYTISDARFFPGTVALINSLRLLGHRESVVVLDCGIRPEQRRSLPSGVSLVPWDRTRATNPTLFKPFAALQDPRGVVVIIDSDVVVTGRLDAIVAMAEAGAICAFPDPEADRWFASWGDLFGLRAPLRRETYVNAGFVVLSARRWPAMLPRWWELCSSIWDAPTIYEDARDGPTAQADQDALNALLMSEVAGGAVSLLDADLGPATGALSGGVRIIDERTLETRFLGKRPLLLHSAGRAKPWIAGDWPFMRPTAYTLLLRRLLTWRDIEVRPRAFDLPPWLRPGRAGDAWMRAVTALVGAAWRVGEHRWIRPAARSVLRFLQRGVGVWRNRS